MYPNYSKILLNLKKDVFIRRSIHSDSSLKIFIETHPKEQICPCCGQKTKRFHDYRLQEIQDIPYQEKHIILVLRKHRYLCKSCGKRFLESYSFLPRYHRWTRRLAFFVIHLLRQTFSLKIENVRKRLMREAYFSYPKTGCIRAIYLYFIPYNTFPKNIQFDITKNIFYEKP